MAAEVEMTEGSSDPQGDLRETFSLPARDQPDIEFGYIEQEETERQLWLAASPLYRLFQSLASPTEPAELPVGLRREVCLYNYQLRSLGKMLDLEKANRLVPNPIYDAHKPHLFGGLAGIEKVEDIQGGILAEEMGTGKTAICISLILTTKGRKARIPSEYSIVYTGLPRWRAAVSSLQDICAAYIARSFDHKRCLLPGTCHERVDHVGVPGFYLEEGSAREAFSMRRMKRRRRVLASHATLMIVPKTLLEQTMFEFGKFSETGALEILLIRELGDVPSPEELVTKDVVIIPATLLQQARLTWDKPEVDYTLCTWACQYGGAAHCKNCYYAPPSPLIQVLWFRVIVDEGHVMGSVNTKQTTVASALHAERRWIVSGTPTPQGSVAKELEYLHGLLSFLRIAPWWTANAKYVNAARSAWRSATSSSATKGAPLPDLLTPLLNRIMGRVRTKLDEVEKEVKLPPLTVAVRVLPWQLPDALRYNHIASQILLNLVTSRGEGIDSLLHSENFRFGLKSIHHLLEACFHTPGLEKDERFLALDVIEEELAGRTHDFSGKAIDPITPEQREALQRMKTLFSFDGWAGDSVVQSTKMNYLMKRISSASAGDKTIVFSQSNDTLRRVADLLDKANISFCEFHQRMSASERASNLLTFCTSESRGVILMKTELAAYGINLACASSVIFLDPLWDRPKEAQAIKRAYRIGQTKPVTVEKLVMENSIEQHMLKLLQEQVEGKAAADEHRRLKTLLNSVSLLPLPESLPFSISLPSSPPPPSPPSSLDPEICFTITTPPPSQPSPVSSVHRLRSSLLDISRKRKVRFFDTEEKDEESGKAVVKTPREEESLQQMI